MKATFDLPEDLYRRVKAKSALQGRPVRDVVVELFGAWVTSRGPRRAKKDKFVSAYDMMRPYIGVVNSGIPDLASNPRHMDGFGKRPPRHR